MRIQLPVTWSMCGVVEVEAPSISEAIAEFISQIDDIPLPSEGTYVDGSFGLSSEDESHLLLCQTKYTKFQLLLDSNMTFMDACAQGLCDVLQDVDDFIEFWHTEDTSGKELQEAFGMDTKQFSRWLREGDAYLLQFVKERAALTGNG